MFGRTDFDLAHTDLACYRSGESGTLTAGLPGHEMSSVEPELESSATSKATVLVYRGILVFLNRCCGV